MRFLLGIATVAAAAAGITAWLRPGPEAELAVVTNVGSGGVATLSVPVSASPPIDSASKPRFFGFALAEPQGQAPVSKTEVPAPTPSVVIAALPPAPPRASWSNDVVVYAESSAAEVRATPVSTKAPSVAAAQPPRDKPRAELVRDLQRELRRIGCYSGEVNGEWTANGKRALRAFLDHVGSRVQIDEPDLIQLTLVRGFSGVACRPANGQMMATKQPPLTPATTIMAQPTAPSPTAPSRYSTASVEQPQAAPAAVTAPLEGRMSVGGPVPEGEAAPPAAAPLPAPPKARPQPKPRQDKAWLNNFFNN